MECGSPVNICRYPDDVVLGVNPTDGTLNCHTHRMFWISWYALGSHVEIKVCIVVNVPAQMLLDQITVNCVAFLSLCFMLATNQ